ncbi:hypothetical protein BP6252_11420 [Coleophoma cylindrospora]|uniref:Nephrocystin 3-like N-terminal domain-containing protein n=1 Tax=Coleophoma cylindrospora TaxID=1849047 RepID=A0A3D8QJR3_9HELO|nr:hypothetical protein BP6252_11420 [Coleophoma cylindrospora]
MSENQAAVVEDDAVGEKASQQAAPPDKKLGLIVHENSSSASPDYDVVALHGLNGNSSVWESTSEKGTWLKDVLFASKEVRIMTYGYVGYERSGAIYTRNGIRNEACKLLSQLSDLRDKESEKKERPLIFLAHDIGGTIVKQALIIAGLDPQKRRSINDLTASLIFFATPHRSISIQSMEDMLVRLLFKASDKTQIPPLQVVKGFAETIAEINGLFIDSKMLIRPVIFNLYSLLEDPAEKIFDQYTVTFNVSFESRSGKWLSHDNLVKNVATYTATITDVIGNDPYPLDLREDIRQYLPIIQSQASPILPLTENFSKSPIQWVDKNETFVQWQAQKKSPLLHVYGTKTLTEVSRYIFYRLESNIDFTKSSHAVLYFEFREHDSRYNTIKAMLNTFLAQILSHYDDMTDGAVYMFKRLVFYRSWSTQDAHLLFEGFRTTKLLDKITFVIGGLDLTSDEAKTWFLTALLRMIKCSEEQYKIVITSTGGKELQDALTGFPSINIDSESKENPAVDNQPSDSSLVTLQIIQARSVFRFFEEKLNELLSRYQSQPEMQKMVVTWLTHVDPLATRLAVQEQLDFLIQSTPEEIVAAILDSVEKTKRPGAKRLIAWIVFALRPLTFWELQTFFHRDNADELDPNDSALTDIRGELEHTFCNLFFIHGNEAYLVPGLLPDIFLLSNRSEDQAWYKYEDLATAHSEIVRDCLHLLSEPSSEQRKRDFELLEDSKSSPLFDSRLDGFSYATQFWPVHFKIAVSSLLVGVKACDLATQAVRAFYNDEDAVCSWGDAYWSFLNPVVRSETRLKSPLSIICGYGPDTLVSQHIIDEKRLSNLAADISPALVEAARFGNFQNLRFLLNVKKLDSSSLREALTAAASYGDEALLMELIKHALALEPNFDFPPDLIGRASWLGLASVVSLLVESGVDVNTPDSLLQQSPLHLSARHNHTSVVQILLDNKADIDAKTKFNTSVLQLASTFGHDSVVKLLIDAGADLEYGSEYTALQDACSCANHEVIKILLESGAKRNYGEGPDIPLVIAAKGGYAECCRLLLHHHGPSTYTADQYGIALSYAVDKGDIDVIRHLLDIGADPNYKHGGAWPILMRAVERNNVELVELFLDRGSNIDETTEPSGYSALSRAASRGFKDVASLLANRGADVNRAGSLEFPPIYLAARNNDYAMVELLLKAGADPNQSGSAEWQALHMAYDFLDVTRLLVSNGANINHLSEGGTPLYLASKWGYSEVVKVYIEHKADLEIQVTTDPDDGHTALDMAVIKGQALVLRLLLEAGANINHRAKNNTFPLQYPITRTVDEKEAEDCLRMLLEYSPPLDMRDDTGYTALGSILRRTPVSLVRLLVNAGAPIESPTKEGVTPLGRAVLMNNIDVLKYLISKKAVIDIPNGKWGGPLHMACQWGTLEIVKILIEGGADVNLLSPGVPGTPLQSAYFRDASTEDETAKKNQILKYLLEETKADVNVYGGQFGCALSVTFLKGTLEMSKYLLEKSASFDMEDEMRRRPIHLACLRTVEHIQLLLDAGEDLTPVDKLGRTPLHYAVISGRVDVVERILDLSGGTVDIPDIDNWTPLLWAARVCDRWGTRTDNQLEVINLLLSRGADPWIRGSGLDREWSAVKIARYHGVSDQIVSVLTPKDKTRQREDGKEEVWDERFHMSKKAHDVGGGFCDACLLALWGTYFVCQTCLDFCLCFKCYRSRDTLHPGHPFQDTGIEYEINKTEDSEKPVDRTPSPVDDTATVVESDNGDDDTDEEDEAENKISTDNIVGEKQANEDGVEDDGDEDDDDEDESDASSDN